MSRTITIRFSQKREYEFLVGEEVAETIAPETAHAWLAQQIEALECTSPTSAKAIPTEMVLGLARCAGETLFAEGGEWAQTFAQIVAALFDRPVVVVDLPAARVS
ncbi:MAG: hypothetical protein N2557_03655 [Hydrogenophilus sp.]|nr:hypothetical protein [Hydrogenophilus sp.]